MRAKILVCALPALILAAIHLVDAQQAGKIPRIGIPVDMSHRFCVARGAWPLRSGRRLRELGHGARERMSPASTGIAEAEASNGYPS